MKRQVHVVKICNNFYVCSTIDYNSFLLWHEFPRTHGIARTHYLVNFPSWSICRTLDRSEIERHSCNPRSGGGGYSIAHVKSKDSSDP